ncbi:hypothetical protein [Paucibacter sp. KCTC 42545]|uniref:hypothetical protein n=1 Tax=Paucibacter sp. KCTC 42545 TaxID=1768242 RepID=UPI000733B8DB|nr:hypothetical protein [Paucibacter sp. KCTC 42545]ALT76712.1 hypothetical protein AT984_05465 [Paucibacter sp. KCTC 42545]
MIDQDLPVWRLNLLRAFYLLITVGLALSWGPVMRQYSEQWAQRSGVLAAMLLGLAMLCVWGLRYPLQMLPLLIYELVWKALWLLVIAYPLWRGGAMTPNVQETAFACLMGIVLTPLVLPWRYIAHHYFSKPAQRWR